MTDGRSTPLAAVAASLHRERTRAGLSLAELARRAGIAKSTLPQLEAGTGNPSLETLWALTLALDVPFARLVDPPRARVQVIRAGEGPAVPSEQADYLATLLAPARLTPDAADMREGLLALAVGAGLQVMTATLCRGPR